MTGYAPGPALPRPFFGATTPSPEWMEQASPEQVIEWAGEAFGGYGDFILTCSFEDCVLIDIATRVAPSIEVVFLDTGFHFPQTLAFMEQVKERYRLNLTILKSGLADSESPCGSDNCCQLRKVGPLFSCLERGQRKGWITGLKRCDAPTRAGAQAIEWDGARQLVKLNPLVRWSAADMADYVKDYNLPVHPLTHEGYGSIGCAPVTIPSGDSKDPRAGRWAGSDKTECGLHT